MLSVPSNHSKCSSRTPPHCTPPWFDSPYRQPTHTRCAQPLSCLAPGLHRTAPRARRCWQPAAPAAPLSAPHHPARCSQCHRTTPHSVRCSHATLTHHRFAWQNREHAIQHKRRLSLGRLGPLCHWTTPRSVRCSHGTLTHDRFAWQNREHATQHKRRLSLVRLGPLCHWTAPHSALCSHATLSHRHFAWQATKMYSIWSALAANKVVLPGEYRDMQSRTIQGQA
jgi:hypothetical protein